MKPITERQCNVCKATKPIENFYRSESRSRSAGYGYVCKECNTTECRIKGYRRAARKDRVAFAAKIAETARNLEEMIRVLAELK